MTDAADEWRLVADGLGPGEITEATVGDLDLVVWRSESGRACVVEARCPHNWSHLGSLGAVDGEEIVCLSHFWRFDADGQGFKVAMSGRRDPKSSILVYPCRDTGDAIYVRV